MQLYRLSRPLVESLYPLLLSPISHQHITGFAFGEAVMLKLALGSRKSQITTVTV